MISGRNKLAPATTYQSISPSVCPSLRFGWIPEIQRVSSRVQNYISCEPLVRGSVGLLRNIVVGFSEFDSF